MKRPRKGQKNYAVECGENKDEEDERQHVRRYTQAGT
jgi:hypothetical protein